MNHKNNFNPDFEKEGITPKKVAEAFAIETMTHNIKEFGSNKTFRLIEENIHNAKTRLRYRRIFLLSGGIIPETEV